MDVTVHILTVTTLNGVIFTHKSHRNHTMTHTELLLTLILTVLATIPSTMFSVKGSKCLSVLLMNSGFRR